MEPNNQLKQKGKHKQQTLLKSHEMITGYYIKYNSYLKIYYLKNVK